MKPPSVPNQTVLYLERLKLGSARCTLPVPDVVSDGWKQLPRSWLVTPGGHTREGTDSVYPPEKRAPTCCLPGALRGQGANREGGPGRWPGGQLE